MTDTDIQFFIIMAPTAAMVLFIAVKKIRGVL